MVTKWCGCDTEVDTDGLILHNDVPVTGIVYGLFDDEVTLASEWEFRDGLPHGVCREFHPNGQLKCIWNADHGQVRGDELSFHPNGVMACKRTCQYGIQLARLDWDENGKLIGEWTIDPDTPSYEIYQHRLQGDAGHDGRNVG